MCPMLKMWPDWSEAHIQEFFESLGFEMVAFSQIDPSFELTSVQKLNLSSETVNTYAEHLKIWSLTLKSLT